MCWFTEKYSLDVLLGHGETNNLGTSALMMRTLFCTASGGLLNSGGYTETTAVGCWYGKLSYICNYVSSCIELKM